MTQILAALTPDYVLLASDRQLTFIDGPNKGQIAEDDACKLISLCHLFGIGYAGLAQLEAKSTHEWIATTLATADIGDVDETTRVLVERASSVVKGYPRHLRRLTLVVVGWERFDTSPNLLPHAIVVSNAHDKFGRALLTPNPQFERHILVLRPGAENSILVIGETLEDSRRMTLKRNLRRLQKHAAAPAQIMRLLVDEIVNTHRHGQGTVGRRVLALCIPKKSVERYTRTGVSRITAMPAVDSRATFAYFDTGCSILRQHAPTFVCGNRVVLVDEIANNPVTGGVARMSFRTLA